MKVKLALLLLLMMFSSLSLSAQNWYGRSPTFKRKSWPSQRMHKVDYSVGLDLGKIPLFTVKGFFEKVLSDFYSFEVAGSLTVQDVNFLGLNSELLAMGGEVGAKFYFPNDRKIAPVGWYISGLLKVESFTIGLKLPSGQSSQLIKGFGFMPGVRVGHQFSVGRFGLLDVGLGAGFQQTKFNGRFSPNGKFLLFGWDGITPSWKVGFAKTF